MASTLLESLAEELDRVASIYESSFAGQSRATRNLDELENLIRRLQGVLSKVDQIPVPAQGPDLVRLRETATQNLRIYETERVAIHNAKKAGPEFEEFARLASSANFVFARYYRHFAGQDRATRDSGLLAEMVEDLKQLRQRMVSLAQRLKNADYTRDADLVASNIDMYQSELGQIQAAQESGTPNDRASILATLANAQFAIYRGHFAGHARTTRRPALLQRVVDNLRRIKEQMTALEGQDLSVDFNTKNISVVDDNLKLYETELGEIRKARQGTKMDEIMGMLGGSANELFDEYRKGFSGKNRTEVSAEQLSLLCDKLGEIARQMLDFSRVENSEVNEQNIDIVVDQLASFEKEYEAIVKAQGLRQSS
jgi:hypothetical protein